MLINKHFIKFVISEELNHLSQKVIKPNDFNFRLNKRFRNILDDKKNWPPLNAQIILIPLSIFCSVR